MTGSENWLGEDGEPQATGAISSFVSCLPLSENVASHKRISSSHPWFLLPLQGNKNNKWNPLAKFFLRFPCRNA